MDSFNIELNEGTRLRIYRGVYEPMSSNMYIIIREQEALVIDPNINVEVPSLLSYYKIQKVHILLTHEHYDHISGVSWLQNIYNCELICNSNCVAGLNRQGKDFPRLVALVLADKDRKDGGHRYEDFKKDFKPFTIRPDIVYNTPCEFKLIGLKFKGIQTPGHSPGSWCLIVNDSLLITGDTLIKDTPVVIRFHESRKNEYLDITLPLLKSLNPNLVVLPGHFDPFILKDNNILDTYTI